jgi:hypothetical protein
MGRDLELLLKQLTEPITSTELFTACARVGDPRLYRPLVEAVERLSDEQRVMWKRNIDAALAACVLNCCM